MAPRDGAGRLALTRQLVLSLSVLLVLSVLVWATWLSGLDVLAWLLSVALLVVAGLSAASLAGSQPYAVLGLATASPIAAGAAAASYADGRAVGGLVALLGLALLPGSLVFCRQRSVARLEPEDEPPSDGLSLFE